MLRDVGVLLGEELRATDSLARMGGDEFAVILEDCGLLDACSIAENIRNAIERYEYRGELRRHRVEVSIGLLELGAEHATPEDALHVVDAACYEAKRAGRDRVVLFDPSYANYGPQLNLGPEGTEIVWLPVFDSEAWAFMLPCQLPV